MASGSFLILTIILFYTLTVHPQKRNSYSTPNVTAHIPKNSAAGSVWMQTSEHPSCLPSFSIGQGLQPLSPHQQFWRVLHLATSLFGKLYFSYLGASNPEALILSHRASIRRYICPNTNTPHVRPEL